MQPKEIVTSLMASGHTAKWIAENAKLAQSTIHRIKVGHVRDLRFRTADKLLAFYQVYQLVKQSA